MMAPFSFLMWLFVFSLFFSIKSSWRFVNFIILYKELSFDFVNFPSSLLSVLWLCVL